MIVVQNNQFALYFLAMKTMKTQ